MIKFEKCDKDTKKNKTYLTELDHCIATAYFLCFPPRLITPTENITAETNTPVAIVNPETTETPPRSFKNNICFR